MVGDRPASSWPRERMRPSSKRVVAGLPRSWHRAPSITASCRGRSSARSSEERRRLVHDLQRVRPHVALGVPARVLGRRLEGQQLRGDHGQHPPRLRAGRGRATAVAPSAAASRSRRRRARPAARRGAWRRTGRPWPGPPPARSGRRAARRAARAAGPRRSVRASTARRSRASRSRWPPQGSRSRPVAGSKSIAFIVKSRRRAASSTERPGSPSTAIPRWPGPTFESRRGRATSTAPSTPSTPESL